MTDHAPDMTDLRTTSLEQPPSVAVSDAAAIGEHAEVPLRVYRPDACAGTALLWVHGGGFAYGDLDMPEADWVARSLAERGTFVVTVDYRLATETVRFPEPSNDVLTAWTWLVDRAQKLSGVPIGSLHLGGASAGGNLALGAALRIRDEDPAAEKAPLPASLLLAYPTLHAVQRQPSDELAALLESLPVESRWGPDAVREMYERFVAVPLESAPAYAVPGTMDPSGLPPTIIVASETDGLRASAEEFAEALASAGVPHRYLVEPGTWHGHINGPQAPSAHATIERFDTWLREHRR